MEAACFCEGWFDAGDGAMKRLTDIFLGCLASIILFVPFLLVATAIRLTSKGPVLYWSDRVGRHNEIFQMPKFRTMQVGVPNLATHMLANPEEYLTPIGSFLRKSSLDEIPQIWSVLVGDMSFVGPRPALFNQYDLIELRTKKKLHILAPGITGWAQVNGRDEVSIQQKVALDTEYIKRKSLWFDIKILCMTFWKVLQQNGVSH
jgi:O-antigen biosynthesis protein WbqP